MELLIAAGTFISVTLMMYGLLYRQVQDPAMEARLGGLRYTRSSREGLPDPEAAFSVRVLQPLARGLSKRMNGLLPSAMTARVETALEQGGVRMKAGQFIMIVGLLAGGLPILGVMYAWAAGLGLRGGLIAFAIPLILSIYAPRMWLLSRIKQRQKQIWRSLPDAFDLTTASVEAGLGIDAAFSRVIEKVEGPFAAELTRTMREIQMGRARSEAFADMAERTGVEELRSLINAIIQAEQMGISIGSVIRVQTGVIRTKRRQKAEEQAFKAPIKMVFPLVLFIFPAIMIVIGGPAVIQIMEAF
jgi:tight adherence protein C